MIDTEAAPTSTTANVNAGVSQSFKKKKVTHHSVQSLQFTARSPVLFTCTNSLPGGLSEGRSSKTTGRPAERDTRPCCSLSPSEQRRPDVGEAVEKVSATWKKSLHFSFLVHEMSVFNIWELFFEKATIKIIWESVFKSIQIWGIVPVGFSLLTKTQSNLWWLLLSVPYKRGFLLTVKTAKLKLWLGRYQGIFLPSIGPGVGYSAHPQPPWEEKTATLMCLMIFMQS